MTAGSAFARLRPWSPRLFLLAGVGAFAFAIDNALTAFTGTSYPLVGILVAPAAFLLAVVGLLGLSADLVGPGGTLARVARGIALLPVVTWTLIIVGGTAEYAGLLSGAGGLPPLLSLVTIVLMILTYLLFGATTLRTDVLPTAVGVLMLLEVAAFLLVATRLVPPYAIDLLHTGINLGIGGLLVSLGTDRAGTDVPADSTA
ncbi:hypothetical protein N0B31_17610 [Salinirubellus salinus]|uniref:Uncharacterized protein n=1 Tax=Salinirubellus salinus TaxID=1364945 RepID=A0A9E7R1C9_9EURY|nr:hypothetical protein [Salinirubellus salinus]UWM53930.1 hypothetical protein N0B31_17610 [Salinirubellus salinus]